MKKQIIFMLVGLWGLASCTIHEKQNATLSVTNATGKAMASLWYQQDDGDWQPIKAEESNGQVYIEDSNDYKFRLKANVYYSFKMVDLLGEEYITEKFSTYVLYDDAGYSDGRIVLSNNTVGKLKGDGSRINPYKFVTYFYRPQYKSFRLNSDYNLYYEVGYQDYYVADYSGAGLHFLPNN